MFTLPLQLAKYNPLSFKFKIIENCAGRNNQGRIPAKILVQRELNIVICSLYGVPVTNGSPLSEGSAVKTAQVIGNFFQPGCM